MSLHDMYAGKESVQEVAALAVHLPRGGAVAEWVGGWGAITAEEEALRRIEWLTLAVNSKNKPAQPKAPESAREADLKARRKRERMERVRRQAMLRG